jgi:predicted phage tail protein
MESGTEILRVTAAIVSAFHTAADTLATIKDNKEKKRRKKERDIEELLEIRILHRSLVEVTHADFRPVFVLTSHHRARQGAENIATTDNSNSSRDSLLVMKSPSMLSRMSL